MQDGAPPHTALSTREFLKKHFNSRIIGKHFRNEWPPYSPDLTPADYYLWPQLKRQMYQGNQPYAHVRTLKKAITYNMRVLSRKPQQHIADSVINR